MLMRGIRAKARVTVRVTKATGVRARVTRVDCLRLPSTDPDMGRHLLICEASKLTQHPDHICRP